MNTPQKASSGFTLIELAIVLVVIGLLVGGVVVGRDLVSAAYVRATITQIEKYNTAANTFIGKYGGLPGDLNATAATQFGFVARAGSAGRGDGNGELDGVATDNLTPYAGNESGENLFFWEDLSSANLIDGRFNTAVDNVNSANCSTTVACSVFFPYAKIGGNNFVYVYSGFASACLPNCVATAGIGPNFFGLSTLNVLSNGNVARNGGDPTPGLTVIQAYNIDKKIDDGLPTSGKVLAQYLGPTVARPAWVAGGGAAGTPPGTAASPSSTTCYDNGGNGSNTMAYSVTQSNGANVNCALSFQMQAGD